MIYFFFNDTATTEIYTLSLHDALPISYTPESFEKERGIKVRNYTRVDQISPSRKRVTATRADKIGRATSELQSRSDLVCRLLLEKKKKQIINEFQNIYIIINNHGK